RAGTRGLDRGPDPGAGPSGEEPSLSERAIASFDITTWDEQPYDEGDGLRLSRARVVKVFRGEIEGESTAELLMAIAGEDTAAYVGVERVPGRVKGRR